MTTDSSENGHDHVIAPHRTLWSYMRLAFEDDRLERRFIAYYTSAYVLQFRLSVLLALVLVVADASLDFFVAPERAMHGNVVRLLGFIPITIAGVLLSFQPSTRARFQLFGVLFSLSASGVLFWSLALLERAQWQGLGFRPCSRTASMTPALTTVTAFRTS